MLTNASTLLLTSSILCTAVQGPHDVAQEVDTLSQVAICANGSYVAFFGQADLEAQTMVWLWAIESGKVQPYGLGLGHVPQNICWDTHDPRVSSNALVCGCSSSHPVGCSCWSSNPSQSAKLLTRTG